MRVIWRLARGAALLKLSALRKGKFKKVSYWPSGTSQHIPIHNCVDDAALAKFYLARPIRGSWHCIAQALLVTT